MQQLKNILGFASYNFQLLLVELFASRTRIHVILPIIIGDLIAKRSTMSYLLCVYRMG